jgi:methionyl-tRNA formyltransferase
LENANPTPQSDHGATYANKLSAADARIDWRHPARAIHRQIRALCGRLPASTSVGDLRIRLLEADWQPETAGPAPGTVLAASPRGIQVACGNGTLLVHRLQLNRGKGRPLSATDASNGYPDIFAVGACLADPT